MILKSQLNRIELVTRPARSNEFDPVLAALADPEEDAAAMAALRILFIWGGGDALPESRDA